MHEAVPERVLVRKHLVGLVGVRHVLLDAEVVDAQVEVQRRGHAHRAQIGGAMAARAHLVQLGQRGDLPQVGDASGVDDRRPHVVDELLLNELLAIEDRVEHLADGDGGDGVPPDQTEALLQFGRRGVLHPEQAMRLERLAHACGLDRRQPVMDVVQQVDFVAELRADTLEQLRHEADVGIAAPPTLRHAPLLGWFIGTGATTDAVGAGEPGNPTLHPDRRVAQVEMMRDRSNRPLDVGAIGMCVHQHGLA